MTARASVAGTLALLLLELLWELALAPIGGRASWLALKALPLALLLPGVARGTTRARQWLALLLPFYFAEGIVRAYGERGRQALVAAVAGALAAATFVALIAWLRADARARDERR